MRTYSAPANSWSITAGSADVDLVNNSAQYVGFASTPFGNWYLYTILYDGTATVSQTVYLTPGQYSLSFEQNSIRYFGSYAGVDVDSASTDTSVFGGVQAEVSDALPGQWWQNSLIFQVHSAGNYVVNFSSAESKAMILDDVQLNAVPEPRGFLVLGVLSLGCLFHRRRRR